MSALPDHLKAPEIKRRCRILAEASRELGLIPAGIEILADGTIRILDKAALPSKDGELGEWV